MNVFKSKWLTAIIIAGIGWLGLALIKVKIHENIVNKEVSGLESKIENIEKENNSIEKLVEYLKHPSFLEKEARLKLNYKAPGENVAFVYSDTSASSSMPNDFKLQLAQMPNYLKWIYYLLGY